MPTSTQVRTATDTLTTIAIGLFGGCAVMAMLFLAVSVKKDAAGQGQLVNQGVSIVEEQKTAPTQE